ncbi:MAG: cyclase family protein [Syntrophales bacterium]
MIYDITIGIHEEMPVWPGDPEVSFIAAKRIARGDSCNVTGISMGMHSGTHIDAPLHFFEGGDAIDKIPLWILMGPCMVAEMNVQGLIESKDLEPLNLDGCKRLLLKTANSLFWGSNEFRKDFSSLGESAATYLVGKGISLIGFDYLSVEGFHAKGHAVHKTLLGNGVIILEGLNLAGINPGFYELICLPLKILGSDGAPARVLLRELAEGEKLIFGENG